MLPESVTKVVLELHECGAIKFGSFTLKGGITSPVYFDLRVIVSRPALMQHVADLLWQAGPDEAIQSDLVCGVPYTALPLATLLSAKHLKPMLIRRKEAKAYGTKKMLEGVFQPGQTCVLVEDVITSGSSVSETADLLRNHGLRVSHALVFLDRGQGGAGYLESECSLQAHSVITVQALMEVLLENGKVDGSTFELVMDFIRNNSAVPVAPSVSLPLKVTEMPFEVRLGSPSSHETSSHQLLRIMLKKKSNLCVAADLTSLCEIEALVRVIGQSICCLKLHWDMITDWTESSGELLRSLARAHEFMLFEDRKLSDIGQTVLNQLCHGQGRLGHWAELVSVHMLPGYGILDAVAKARQDLAKPLSALIVAEMSCKGNLIDSDYSRRCVEMARQRPQLVAGLISQSRLDNEAPLLLHMTPGVKMADDVKDGLGQQYVSPEDAVVGRGADVIIVGRGIICHPEPAAAAEQYRKAGWSAYLKRTGCHD